MCEIWCLLNIFFFQAEDGIRDGHVTGVQTCALPICKGRLDFQLIYIASGNGRFHINNKTHHVSNGQIVIYTPNEPQHYQYRSEERRVGKECRSGEWTER